MPNLAIIGLGKMGLLHAGVHSALGERPISAVCEKDRFLVKLAQKLIPNAKIYEEYDKMIVTEDPDAVVITTPIHTHADIVLDIMRIRRDIGIFVEKPLTTNHDTATRVCDAVNRSSTIHMVGFQKRFSATFRKAKDILTDGEIGSYLFFRSYSFTSDILRRGQGWRFKMGTGGVTLDIGPHLLDLIIWYFGEPRHVTGIQKRLYSDEVEDYVHVNMEFENGLTGYADLSWSVRNYRLPEVFLEIHGTNGILTVNDDYVKVQMDKDGMNLIAGNYLYRRAELQPSVPFLLADPEFTLEDEEFRSAVQERRSTQPDFFSAAKVNQLIDKIHNLQEVMANNA